MTRKKLSSLFTHSLIQKHMHLEKVQSEQIILRISYLFMFNELLWSHMLKSFSSLFYRTPTKFDTIFL